MRIRWLPVVLVALAVALQAEVVAASPDHLPPPERPWLLAVGDSITYGWSSDPHYDGGPHSWALQVRASAAFLPSSLSASLLACWPS